MCLRLFAHARLGRKGTRHQRYQFSKKLNSTSSKRQSTNIVQDQDAAFEVVETAFQDGALGRATANLLRECEASTHSAFTH